MCRIVGRVSNEHGTNFEEGLLTMLSSVEHGGPDDQGVYFDESISLGHRRLSIIDLSTSGHQPMMTEDSDLIISFNGEIYNYLDLKSDLEKAGFNFISKTDTEVILKAYQFWGTEAFSMLEGIFAFALYDKKQNFFFLVRDHFGVKPLYYFIDEKELLFSSEVRAFTALRNDWKENTDWPMLFLAFGFIPHPYTTLSQVVQLSPGSYLRLNTKSFTRDLEFYYKYESNDQQGNVVRSNDEALAQVKISIHKALQKNLLADAPLGVFLSGGIDSSLLTLLANRLLNKVRTLSINFEDASYDERPFQQLVVEKAKSVEHKSQVVTEKMFWEYLDDIWKAMDQPSIDAVNAYFVTRYAKAEGIKSVLSGLGADEIFGGYASFKRIKWMRFMRNLPMINTIGRMMGWLKKSWGRLTYLNLPGPMGDYLFLRGIHTPNEIALLLNAPENEVWRVLRTVSFDMPFRMSDMEYASLLEFKIYMSNQLLKDTDYMGMWHGVEVRVPFLDVRLVEKVQAILPSIRYRKDWPKYLLTASHQDVLPKEIVFREKKGFTFPFALWLQRSPDRFKDLMQVGKPTELLLAQFKRGKCHWSKCWSLAVLQQFR
jgi:asparagine synthase (glutamine-hydrolysing)